MQTKLILALVSLLLGTALASPVDEDWHRTGEQESEFGNSNGVFQQEETGSDNSEVIRGEDGVELSQFYINEIRKQLEAPRSSVGEEDEQRNKRSTGRVVTHGSTVAIQALHDKRHWLGCASSTGGECHKASHPGLYMEGDNWRNCYGEVFQIYHTSGPGDVLVGDLVGIYYPREQGWWFSMAGGRGHKANCPGLPNSEHGFANELLWYRCCGEVFLIYARGKAIGTPILEHDDITLLFLQPQQWVSFVNDVPDSRTCSGTDYPPPPNKYDVCWGEIFEIWLQ